jgi:hypothetical protein
MRVYQFRHVGAVSLAAFTSCSTLPPNSATISGFANLRQTNFRLPFAASRCYRIVFLRLGRFEESESIADQLQMSKGYDAKFSSITPMSFACSCRRMLPAARFGRQVRRIPTSSVTLRVKTCQSHHCAERRPIPWLNKIKKTI